MERLKELCEEYNRTPAFLCFFDIMEARLSQDEMGTIKNSLMKCQCCLRHQTNRTGDSKPVEFPDGCLPCACKCRHYYRLLNAVHSGPSEPVVRVASLRK